MRAAVVFLIAAASAFGQSIQIPPPFYSPFVGAALPSTCFVGQVFFKTSAISGSNLYGCTAPNVWTVQAGGGGGGVWGGITGLIPNQTDLQNALNSKQATITGAPGTWPAFATVATSGNYTDLSNKPTLTSLGGFANPMTAAGDFIVGGSSGIPQRFAAPGNGTWCLNIISGTTTWVTCPGVGSGLTSVGITMPGAFTVTGSPLTVNGTIAITGAGTSLQYITGAGALATFPTIPTITGITVLKGSGGNAVAAAYSDVVGLWSSCVGFLKNDGTCSTPGGGSVTVVGSGTLTSTALVTGGGAQTIQTPNATATMDSGGNISTPGGISTGAGGTGAGYYQFGQGTAPSAGTTAVTLFAPAAVTSYLMKLPAAAATGLVRGDNSFGTVTLSQSELSGDVSTSGSNVASLATKYKTFSCTGGWGDGLNAITAGTYVQFSCVNTTGVTWTITGINCYTDNAGTTTLNAANNAATGLLTGAVTCNNTKSGGGAAGTQSATTTIAANDAITFTGVADGTSKQLTYTVTLTK